jgi:hypothetical protein
MMVMALLILFGFTIYTTIYTGSGTLNKMEAQKNAQMDARIALSYINVRLRQNDGWDRIRVLPNSLNSRASILVEYRDTDDPTYDYDTWIFWAEGVLQEVLADAGGEPDWLGASVIVPIDSFDAFLDDSGVLTHTVGYTYSGAAESMSGVYALRSGRAGL